MTGIRSHHEQPLKRGDGTLLRSMMSACLGREISFAKVLSFVLSVFEY
jgi:hypothetical protein